MSNFGTELIFAEILPKLPVKSIMRFKCVSKPFKAQISSRGFVKLYLRHRSLSTDPDDLLFVVPRGNHINCYDLDSVTATPSFSWNVLPSLDIVGSIHGLFCIIYNTLGLGFDMRPVTDCYLSVINPVTRICQDILSPFPRIDCHHFGFAFDIVNLDFKIVGFFDQQSEAEIVTRFTKVYSLNTKLWTETETKFPGDIMAVRRCGGGTLINDSLLHWLFSRGSSSCELKIGCFDVCKSKWVDDVWLPHCYYDPTHKDSFVNGIGVLDDLLCTTIGNEVERCSDVWVMKEYGVQDSWCKLFSIPFSNDLKYGVMPVVCRKGSAEVLIRVLYTPTPGLVWYNRNNGEISEAKFDGEAFDSMKQVYMCTRSVVDLPNGKTM